MPAIIGTRAPFCARCYTESIARAAREQPDHATREIMLRAAQARIAREGGAVTTEAHAMHPRRVRPWPSQQAA